MNITLTEDKKIEIRMKKQIEEAIVWYGESITEKPVTPATKGLFNVDENSELLDERKSEIFHSVVAKLLFIEKRARPDIETAILYLCTRVSRSTKEDWLKLRRLLGFLQNTINDARVIGADSLHNAFTWIDAAYGVHNTDMKSHTGGVMSLGTGTIHQKSTKQKLNVKSSTEAEIVGSSEYMPYNVWFCNFMESQGYKIKENILFQDNESAIKIKLNGRKSCTGNSRHVNIRYFFVKDLVDRKAVKIMYCPTGKMLADFFTKALQGELFRFFRSIIMGHTSIFDLISEDPRIKERIEKWVRFKSKLIPENYKQERKDDVSCAAPVTTINNNKSVHVSDEVRIINNKYDTDDHIVQKRTYADVLRNKNNMSKQNAYQAHNLK